MSSTLRPREIQTRIRAGASPEDVAEAAQTTVEAIMPYVGPVLAERDHIAGRAQKASLRRREGTARTLADAVAAHLQAHDLTIDDVAWDAFRRDDGRWEVTGRFATQDRVGTARLAFDLPGNYVLSENDDARWLVGDGPAAQPSTPRDDLEHARQRRLAAAPSDDESLLGDDALDLVGDSDVTIEPPIRDEPLRATTVDVAADDAQPEEASAAQEQPRRPVAKKRGRASVPSWDEIMFGGSSDG